MKLYICPNCNEKNFGFKKRSICTKCGKIYDRDECEQIIINKEPFTECPMCGTKYDHPVTECTAKNKKLEPICGFGYQLIDDAEELAKMNEEKERKQQEMLEYELEHPNIPKCPTCGSTNIEKLSFTKKVISIGGLGILSNKIGKTYQCKNCKSTW